MERTTLLFITAMLAVAASSAPASAQPRSHTNEVTLSAGFFHAQDSDSGTLSGQISLGHYLEDPHWQVGIEQGLDWNILEDAEDVWHGSTFPYLLYHFGRFNEDTRFVPFIGGVIGGIYDDEDGTGAIGPTAGIKAFVDDNTFVQMKYRYEWYFNEQEFDEEESDGSHVVNVGIGYIW